MEFHQYYRSDSSRFKPIYDRSWRVQADQEDGTAKIDLTFLQHEALHSWGFLFVDPHTL